MEKYAFMKNTDLYSVGTRESRSLMQTILWVCRIHRDTCEIFFLIIKVIFLFKNFGIFLVYVYQTPYKNIEC